MCAALSVLDSDKHRLEPAQISLPKISNGDEDKKPFKKNRTFAIQQDAGHIRLAMSQAPSPIFKCASLVPVGHQDRIFGSVVIAG